MAIVLVKMSLPRCVQSAVIEIQAPKQVSVYLFSHYLGHQQISKILGLTWKKMYGNNVDRKPQNGVF